MFVSKEIIVYEEMFGKLMMREWFWWVGFDIGLLLIKCLCECNLIGRGCMCELVKFCIWNLLLLLYI